MASKGKQTTTSASYARALLELATQRQQAEPVGQEMAAIREIAESNPAFLAFLHSFDELLIALFVSGIQTATLPKKMWESLQEINPTITAVSTLLVAFTVLSLGALAAVQAWGERRRAASQ